MNKPLSLSLTLLGITSALYAGISFLYIPAVEHSLAQYEALSRDLANLPLERQKDLAFFYAQLANIEIALEEKTPVSNFLVFLDAMAHPDVTLDEITLSVPDRRATLSGVAKSAAAFESQLRAWERSTDVQAVGTEEVVTQKTGITFRTTLTFHEGLFAE